MEGPAASEATQGRSVATLDRSDRLIVSLPSFGRRDLLAILVLLLAATGIRAWLVSHTEVAARDSIGYIRYAYQLEQKPWKEVFEQSEQHPGYPFAILATSRIVRQFASGPECVLMQWSAQLANSLAGVLLVLPMYFLGRELFHRAIGFWAALLYQCLPASGRVLSDGLSEGWFLLFACAALWMAARALRTHSCVSFLLTGLLAGLSYLVRPEGALIVIATGGVLLGMQAVAGWRTSWRRVLVSGAGLGFSALVVVSPFMLITRSLTTKPTAHRILESTPAEQSQRELRSSSSAPLAVWSQNQGEGTPAGFSWGVTAFVVELIKACHYTACLPGLLALWWFRARLGQVPGMWVIILVWIVLAAVLCRMAMVVGYLSDRHTLLLLLCSTYWMTAGSLFVGACLAQLLDRASTTLQARRLLLESLAPVLLLLLMIGLSLPKTLEPLHANRSGFRAAGLWLAENTAPSDPVIDPYFWSHFYSGRVFTEGKALEPPPGHKSVRYVVLERAGLEHVRLRLLPEAERLKDQGYLVYQWSGKRPRTHAEVHIYAVPAE